MGIYSRLLESAIEDSFNTPNDVGVDLKQVEEDIAGPGGIAAHEPEINDAVEGVIGDPIEEAFMIMYEGEYNYNQIMQAVGMHELRETASGREIIYEAADIRGFFKTIKDWIVSFFKSIAKAFKTIIDKLGTMFKSDKSFVAKYKDDIIRGEKNMKNNLNYPEGYRINYKYFDGSAKLFDGIVDEVKEMSSEIVKDIKDGNFSREDMEDITPEKGKEFDSKLMEEIAGVEVHSISEMVEKFTERIFGKKTSLKGWMNAEDVIKTLEKDNEIKSIKKMYEEVKKSCNEALKIISNLEREAVKKSSEFASSSGRVMAMCDFGSKRVKHILNLVNAVRGVHIKAVKMYRSQARRLAVFFKNAGGYKKTDDSKPVGESGIFSSMNFV